MTRVFYTSLSPGSLRYDVRLVVTKRPPVVLLFGVLHQGNSEPIKPLWISACLQLMPTNDCVVLKSSTIRPTQK